MAKHIHIHTHDYGTSEGAKKAAATRARGGGGSTLPDLVKKHGMNSPEAHAKRASLREQGENKAGYKASMARQGKSEYAKRMASASPRYKELAETSPLKAHLAGQTPNYSEIAKADAERKRLNETKYKNVSTRPMRNTSKYFFNR